MGSKFIPLQCLPGAVYSGVAIPGLTADIRTSFSQSAERVGGKECCGGRMEKLENLIRFSQTLRRSFRICVGLNFNRVLNEGIQ